MVDILVDMHLKILVVSITWVIVSGPDQKGLLTKIERDNLDIAYLSNSTIPSREANSIQVIRMCNALVKIGFDVTLYHSNDKRSDESIQDYYGILPQFEKVSVQRPSVKILGALAYSLNTRKSVFKGSLPSFFYGRDPTVLLAVSSTGIPFCYESHSPPLTQRKKLVERFLFKSQGFKYLIVISNALKKIYLARFPFLHSDKIIVAPDGAEPRISQEFANGLTSKAKPSLRIGYVGHLYPGRGMDLILSLASSLPEAEFHIVGGTDGDVEAWMEKARADNLTFYGFVRQDEVQGLLRTFDAVLAPYEDKVSVAGGGGDTSKWMSPLKIFEYMSAGKPIIASDLPVLKEVLEHRRNALLCKPDDVNQWLDAINLIHNNPDFAKTIAKQAERDFIENYTWTARAKMIMGHAIADGVV